MAKRMYIIDADPGIDDARAILFLLSKPDVEVLAITTVSGNSPHTQTCDNARKILEAAGIKNVPVYQGTRHNLCGDLVVGNGYHGDNGLCNIELPPASLPRDKTMTSFEALLHYSIKFPGKITLIAIGPLTNLALAFIKDYKFPARFERIFVMGSDRHPTTVINMTKHAEFNTYCDPVAANIVYKNFRATADAPIFLVDWFFCWNHQLPADLFNRIVKELENQKGKEAVATIFSCKGDVNASTNYSTQLKLEGLITADEFATILAYDESLIIDYKLTNVATCLEGECKGHTSFAEVNGGNVKLIEKINMEKFVETFIGAFAAQKIEKNL